MTDEHSAHKLELYIENDADLYRQMTTPIHKNLATKKARGEYKHDLAVKAFMHLMEAGAKKYAREFGSPDQPWHKMFDVPTRKYAAERFAKEFETEYALGNYDHLLPKKYQQPKARAHATKKKESGSSGPRVLKISGDKSFASLRSITATVQYPGESPMRVEFVGPSIKGASGPVVMVTASGAQTVVSDPSRFGAFGKDWVRRFFGEA